MVTADINLSALRHNARICRVLAPDSALMAVIKANAYGHGMLQVADALSADVDGFAVARIEEALALRQHGIERRLLVLSSRPDREQLELASQLRIDLVVHEADTVHLIGNTPLASPIGVWLKIDTGMHRLGVAPEQAPKLYRELQASPAVGELLVMSHFASAEDRGIETTDNQMQCFDAATTGLDAEASLANSAAIITRPDSHRQWIRPGIMLYGANPLGEAHPPQLQPVMTLRAKLLAVRDITAGDGVGYNHTWSSRRASRIGTVAVGYGDGYPRNAGNGTPVLINGRRAPLAGRVSMDTITLDLTEHRAVRPGDEVILWGDGLPVNEIAGHAGTIAYELLTRVTGRANYIYRESDEALEK